MEQVIENLPKRERNDENADCGGTCGKKHR
jgi:hypothetical protein